MKILFPLVLVVFSVAACGVQSKDKEPDVKAVADCMGKQQQRDDYSLVTSCERLGPQERFDGVWFVGFEESAFKNTKGSDSAVYELVVPQSVGRIAHARDALEPSAFKVSFMGRKSMQEPTHPTIVLDEITSIEATQRNASEQRVAETGH
jgi:hypothetical protein